MRIIETSIEISASAERVWDVLTRFAEYPDWNPFITTINGVPSEGTKLQVRINPPSRSGMTFKPTVIVVARHHQLAWLGHLLLPGLFDGEHTFRIDANGAACRFHQSERFSGILVSLFSSELFNATQRGFEAMNIALKERAEAGA